MLEISDETEGSIRRLAVTLEAKSQFSKEKPYMYLIYTYHLMRKRNKNLYEKILNKASSMFLDDLYYLLDFVNKLKENIHE